MDLIQLTRQSIARKRTLLCVVALVLSCFTFALQPVLADEDGAYTVQVFDSFAITGKGTILHSRILTGAVSVGDTVCVPLTGGETVPRQLMGIERFRDVLESAEAGQIAGLLVEDVDPKLVNKDEQVHGDCELPSEE